MTTIVLGGVTLSGSLLWEDKDSYSAVAQTTKRTLGGALVVYHQPLSKGRPITLTATEDTGWITRAMLDSLQTMAQSAGSVYTLNLHGFVVDVVFRHHEPPALSFSPLQPRATPLAGDYYIGQIKLLTV